MTSNLKGSISQVIGAVVDVTFEENLPAILIALSVQVGDKIKLISPNGVRTAFGTSPRVKQFKIVYIFTAGRYDIDRTRSYLPFSVAQEYFNREGLADEIEVLLDNPSNLTEAISNIENIVGPDIQLWTWRDASSSFLKALDIEDNVMFVLMSILVMIASMNIISGLIMLVKNKGRDIGILRTIGLSKGSIMRVFLICGASTGILGTFFGLFLGPLGGALAAPARPLAPLGRPWPAIHGRARLAKMVRNL